MSSIERFSPALAATLRPGSPTVPAAPTVMLRTFRSSKTIRPWFLAIAVVALRAADEVRTRYVGSQVLLALNKDPDAAKAWLTRMRNNDVVAALGKCRGSAVWVSNGRNACRVPLWLDGPGAAP